MNFHGKYHLCYSITIQHQVLQMTTLLQAIEARQRSMNLSIDSAARSIDGCAIDWCLR